MKQKAILTIFILLTFTLQAFSQISVKDSSLSAVMFSGNYAYNIPGKDLAKRFCNNSSIGGSFLIKTRSNWLYGLDGSFIFRDTVKENSILDSISTDKGEIINKSGEYADVYLRERGFYLSFKFGKLFPVFNSNPNSGIVFLGAIGLLQHKIRIDDDGNTAPQLQKDYKKGYDRLTNGLGINEFIGYMYLSNNRLINFFGGFEFTQAWTQCRRDYNFDTMSKDTSKRFDLLSGIKIGWILPIYKHNPKKFYYY